MTSAWRILRWSSELARGELSHPTHGVLAFDADVATVGRFVEGECVDVELRADGRVRSVRPRVTSSPKLREPELSVTPTGLFDFRFASDDERLRIEDVVFERLALASVPSDPRTGYLRDVPDACRALLEALSGRALEPFVRVDASYFFVWSGRQFEEVVTRLPGFRGGTSFFGDGTVHDHREPAPLYGRTPPFLDVSFEPHALVAFGLLRARDWNAWHAALLEHTRHLPRQTW
ncbi:MAG: hypothetical protein DI536_19855 [Archangium gephyra]|uniref:Uncharacterized protein n=1 Tax=Archangium gephyra TaxID=48 RepID=A0A2W5T4Z3_9BACT|nr:MAG: hypothetical protein DI536_19855 [Archangium gephyra]